MSNQSFTHGGPGARRRPVLASLVALCLSACAVTPQPAPPSPPAPPADPVLQAVAAAAPNTPVTVNGPQGTETVTVLSDYISGEGDECRAYSMAAPGAPPATLLACHDGAGWRDITPLAPQSNPGSQP